MTFPAAATGHARADEETSLAMCVALVRFKKGVNAFPSIPILEDEELDMRVGSNGKYLYLYSKKNDRLFALELSQVISGARFHASGGKTTERKAKGTDEKPLGEPKGELFSEPVADLFS